YRAHCTPQITEEKGNHIVRKLFYAAFSYMIIGVLSGLYYRELTKSREFSSSEFSQLPLVHTHVLTLGFVVLTIILVLEHQCKLSQSKLFNWFFWTYNIGLMLSAGLLAVRGTSTAQGMEAAATTEDNNRVG